MGTFISTERRDAVALVTIDNPPMNALVDGAARRARGGGRRARRRRRRSARSCCAARASAPSSPGADIKEFPSLRESASEGGSARGIQKLGHRMDAARTPFVAAIRGFCLGGGLELAMCCDVRICADDAKLGQPEIKLGLIPGGGGTQRLPRLVGHGRAMLLNLTGEFVDAETAYAWGLVERVVPRRGARGGGARCRRSDRGAVAARGRRAARARADDARPLARGRASAARRTRSCAASARRTAPRASRRSSRSARRRFTGR